MILDDPGKNPYQLISSAFSVIDIATPIRMVISVDQSVETAWEEFMNQGLEYDITENPYCLVTEGDQILGYITAFEESFENLNLLKIAQTRVGDVVKRITADMLIPSSMTLLNALPLFQDRYSLFFFLVLVLFSDDFGRFLQYSIC